MATVNGAPAYDAGEAIEIKPADYDAFERTLTEVQKAYSDEDVGALRLRMTPEMLSYFSEELSANAARGVVNKISDVKLLQGDLAEAWREGDDEYATVAMRYSQVDKLIDRVSGKVVAGRRHAGRGRRVLDVPPRGRRRLDGVGDPADRVSFGFRRKWKWPGASPAILFGAWLTPIAPS